MGELEPGPGEGFFKFIRVGQEVFCNLAVGRIHLEGKVGGGHHGGMAQVGVVGILNGTLGSRIGGRPLVSTRGALGQLPIIFQEGLQVAHIPFCRPRFPSALGAAADGVTRFAGAKAALPAEAHLLNGGGFGLGTDQSGIASAVTLAKGMATGHQGHGFLIVHGHAGKGLAHIDAGGGRVRIAVGAFRINVDQAHLHGCQGVLKVAFTGVALVAQPLFLGTPVNIFLRFPHIFPTAGKPEHLKAHGFHGAVARQDHEVGPGDFLAVFLLDGPEQAASLIEIDIVRPAVEGRETLGTVAGTAAAIPHAVGAGAVPGHADEERPVVAVIGRPPLLGVRHQLVKVLLNFSQIELYKFFCVVKIRV